MFLSHEVICIPFSDGTTALSHHCVDLDVPVHRDSHRARPVDQLAGEEGVGLRLISATGEAADLRGSGECVIQSGKQVFAPQTERVRQYQHMRSV